MESNPILDVILKTELSGFFWYIEYEVVCLCVIKRVCEREKGG